MAHTLRALAWLLRYPDAELRAAASEIGAALHDEGALERMIAMRVFMRSRHVDGVDKPAVLERVGLTRAEVEDMYRVMAIANYEDRFVIPTAHREYAENAFNVRGGCGFSFGNGCSEGVSETSLFGSEKKRTIPIKATV